MTPEFRRAILINSSIILGSFIVFGLVFFFLSRTLAAKAGRILADRAVIAARAGDQESLSQLQASLAEVDVFQKKIDALLPTQDELIGFPQFMNNLARTHSLGLSFSFSGSPVPPVPPAPGYVVWSAVAEGSPQNIARFVDELESRTTRFAVNLHEVDFGTPGGSGRATLQGRVFFRDNKITAP